MRRPALPRDARRGHHYVDAMALDLVRKPWEFDVLVMENLLGDILSDLGAGLVGGMGLAPSAEIGEQHGLFQPSARLGARYAGRGIANPTAMMLSAALMLDWLGERHGLAACSEAARTLERRSRAAFPTGALHPIEQGGSQSTTEVANAVIGLYRRQKEPAERHPTGSNFCKSACASPRSTATRRWPI